MEIIRVFLGILLIICLFLNIDFNKIRIYFAEKNIGIEKQEENMILGLSLVDFKGRVKVAGVLDYTPARKAGIEEGDRILEVNGKKIPNVKTFKERIQEYHDNKIIKLVIHRVDSCSTFPVDITPFESNCK
ncbi:MAG: PDZ domain-containing protein [Clostridium sp.]|nr:PDZ domain-containing protein [Clostridium sp.]